MAHMWAPPATSAVVAFGHVAVTVTSLDGPAVVRTPVVVEDDLLVHLLQLHHATAQNRCAVRIAATK